ncbi:MAG: 50S ribosomal protein L22 [Cyclobacteriaceae bacterium]|jgi:large subunit ribosomal protein L22|nr:50S ribosomal protein L22 [Cyclobacteriaceae bacterium]
MEETVKKTKRSVVKRAKLEAIKEAAKTGPATAYLKDVPTSPRKMRLVADMIRGTRVNHALNLLKYEAKYSSQKLEKLLLSAISNWSVKNSDQKLEEADLFIKEIFVDGGRQLKRLRPAPQGRAHRIRKRSNHVTLVVDSMVPVVEKPEAKKTEKAEKPVKKAAKKKSTKKETKE